MTVAAKLDEFFDAFPVEVYKKSKQFIMPGDEVRQVIYLLEGEIDQYDISESGDKLIVNTFKPGAFLPMSYVLNSIKSRYFFEASSRQVKVRLAPASRVVEFVGQNPDVALDLLARVYRGLDGLLDRLATQMGGSARDRIWRQLVINSQRFGEESSDGYLTVRLTESKLAEQTGLARETVSRELTKLKLSGGVRSPRQGLIEVSKNSAIL